MTPACLTAVVVHRRRPELCVETGRLLAAQGRRGTLNFSSMRS